MAVPPPRRGEVTAYRRVIPDGCDILVAQRTQPRLSRERRSLSRLGASASKFFNDSDGRRKATSRGRACLSEGFP